MIIYRVILPTVLLHFAFAGCRVNLSLFALELQASAFTVGVIASLLALLPMTFAIGAGRVLDRTGARTPMLLGAATTVAGLVLAYALPRLETLFLVSMLVGSGFMLFHIAVNHVTGTLGPPADRVRNFSLLALGFSFANFAGPTATGFAIDWIGHRATFLILAGSAVASLLVTFFRGVEIAPAVHADRTGKPRRIADLFRLRTMRRVMIISASLSMAWDMFSFMVPIHCHRIGISASQIGLILGAFGIAVFAVRVVLPLFAHRTSEWQMMIIAMLVSGATFFVFPLLTTVPVLMLLAFILGVGLGGSQPMIMAMIYAHAPPGRGGEAVGLRTLLLNFSQAGIPLLFGGLGAALGMTPVFWTMAVVLTGSGWLLRKP